MMWTIVAYYYVGGWGRAQMWLFVGLDDVVCCVLVEVDAVVDGNLL
jgi:hypothetical protein